MRDKENEGKAANQQDKSVVPEVRLKPQARADVSGYTLVQLVEAGGRMNDDPKKLVVLDDKSLWGIVQDAQGPTSFWNLVENAQTEIDKAGGNTNLNDNAHNATYKLTQKMSSYRFVKTAEKPFVPKDVVHLVSVKNDCLEEFTKIFEEKAYAINVNYTYEFRVGGISFVEALKKKAAGELEGEVPEAPTDDKTKRDVKGTISVNRNTKLGDVLPQLFEK